MRKIVFHKRRATFDSALGLKLDPLNSPAEIERTLDQFENTPDAVLNSLAAGVIGWKTSVWADEVEFEFVGDGWLQSEMAQGRNRARPVFLRRDDADIDKEKMSGAPAA